MKSFPTILISVIVLILIIGALFFIFQFIFNQFGNIQKYLQSEEPETQEEILEKEIQTTKSIIKSAGPAPVSPTEPEPAISINTYITSGPEQEEIIDDTNKITFEFKAEVPKNNKERISFETKVEGFDEDWKSTSSTKRTITFSPGPKEYTFLVRAKIKNSVDPSPASRTFKINTSPYFGKVEIYRIKYKTSSQPSQITLNSRLGKEEKINITNWYIKANKGKIIIPKGIEKYQSFVSPQDIFIKQSDKIYLVSGSNPWGGSNPLGKNKNFRLNKCFGYFLKYYEFSPSFSKICPQSKLEEISYLNENCQEFILNLSKCEIPDYQDNIKILFDMKCRTYMDDNFNYNACFKNYQKDKDFLKNYWYVYLNTDIVSELHDLLYLRDQNGLLVDKYIY